MSFWKEPLWREILSRMWEHCFWVPYEERVYTSCQKFVNSLPELHRLLQCHSRCHFLLGEVVISNFNFAMWSKPYVWMCVHAQMCVHVHAGLHVWRFICVGLCACQQAHGCGAVCYSTGIWCVELCLRWSKMSAISLQSLIRWTWWCRLKPPYQVYRVTRRELTDSYPLQFRL